MNQSDAMSWIDKAKIDLDVVRRSLAPMPDQNLEAAAYHCQQAAEKAIKALLVCLGIGYPRGGGKGHDLGVAVANIPPAHPQFDAACALVPLTPWATAYRYPSEDPATAPAVPRASDIERWLERVVEFSKNVQNEIESTSTPSNTPK